MLQLKIGIHLASLGHSFRQAISFASRAGAKGVIIEARGDLRPGAISQTGIRSLRKLLDDARLSVIGVEFATRRGYETLDDLDRRVDATKKAMDLAFALRSPLVLNHVGQIPESADDPRWAGFVEVLTDLGAYSQRAGAWLAANVAASSVEDFSRLWDALPQASLLIDLDPGLAVMNGFAPLDYVERFGNHVAHVHARDASRDARARRGHETTLGRGEVEFPLLLAALEETGYRGYFTLERDASADAAFEIERGMKYLRELVMG